VDVEMVRLRMGGERWVLSFSFNHSEFQFCFRIVCFNLLIVGLCEYI